MSPTEVPPTHATHLRGMDGLRAIAALTVLVHHTGLYGLGDGTSGVQLVDDVIRQLAAGVLLFFTLSGLLLYRPFALAIVGARQPPTIRTFLRNRALRILPAYWVILLLAGVVLAIAVVPDPDRMLRTGSLADHPGALLANLFLVQGYAPSTFLTGIGPAWTLVVEVGFYVVLPIVAAVTLAAARLLPRRRVALVFAPPAVFLVIGLVGKLVATAVLDGSSGWSRTWPSVLARSFFANADLFAAGMAVAAVAALVEVGRLQLPRWWRPVALAGAGVALAAALRMPDGEFTVFRYDQLATIAAGLVVAVLAVANQGRGRAMAMLEARSLVAVGLASYSLYLWHQPVIDWLLRRGVLPVAGVGGLLVAVTLVGVASGALAAATYRYVERPALRRKRPVQTTSTGTGSEQRPPVVSQTT